MSSKLNILASKNLNLSASKNLNLSAHNQFECGLKNGFISGFEKAFEIIDENLASELILLAEFQPNGERLMTLKLYKAKIANILTEMEKENE